MLLYGQGGEGGRGRAFEFHLGEWYNGNDATIYELRTIKASGVLQRGLVATAVVHDSLGRRRAFYGAGLEFQALRGAGQGRLGPYMLAAVQPGLSTDTGSQAVAILWSVGVGLEWRPLGWLAVGLETRYRLEDRGPRGFWRASPGSREGMSAAIGFSLGGHGRRDAKGASGSGSAPAAALPPPEPPATVSGNAADVVETAISVLGTPYQWGGNAENGFDCSGLIQYAYGQHGIRLPRKGEEQAHAGAEVTPVPEALRPGDILLFSAHDNGGVTHVGMYVGEAKFIHSASGGVKLSRLDPHDPDGAYWMTRWVGARRVIP